MRIKLVATLILPLVLLLGLVPAIISFAQVPGDERITEGGTKGPVLAALPPIRPASPYCTTHWSHGYPGWRH